MIRRIHSGGEFESDVGYCRAVVAGGFVHVAGCIGAGDTVVEQCRSALQTIDRALREAGTGFENAVRVTYMLPDRNDFAECWPLLRAAFGENPPVATMIQCGLIDPANKIEIEVTALVGDTSG